MHETDVWVLMLGRCRMVVSNLNGSLRGGGIGKFTYLTARWADGDYNFSQGLRAAGIGGVDVWRSNCNWLAAVAGGAGW